MTRRPRILHLFSNAFDPPWNWDDDPISRLTWPASALVRHTNRRRVELLIGTLRPPPPEAAGIPGLRLHTLPIAGRQDYPRAIVSLARWLRREGIDVVQTHLFDATVVGQIAARLAGTPLTVTTGHHSHEFAVFPRGLTYWLDALCSGRLAHRALVPSHFMREEMARILNMPPERIAVVPHGLDERRLMATGDGALARRELGLEDRLVVGAIGRLHQIKQYESLIRAFSAVAGRWPETSLLIVGEGVERPHLESIVRALGLADRVRMPGLRGDVPALLAAMDLFVHPALTESFGLVLIEAMAAGKPVLATAVGIAPNVIGPEIGLLVPPGDGPALTEALERMLALRASWPSMGATAQQLARQFQAARMVAAYEEHQLRWLAEAVT
jgi:glycosyltransferase involved in cell wall biosynthesis